MSNHKHPKRHAGLRTDPKISQLLQDSVENRAALTQKQKRDRARKKATYDLPPQIQEAVTAIAKQEDTSTSQIVGIFLAYAVEQYKQKEKNLIEGMAERSPSRTPRFSWNLHVPPKWMQAVIDLAGETENLPLGWKRRG